MVVCIPLDFPGELPGDYNKKITKLLYPNWVSIHSLSILLNVCRHCAGLWGYRDMYDMISTFKEFAFYSRGKVMPYQFISIQSWVKRYSANRYKLQWDCKGMTFPFTLGSQLRLCWERCNHMRLYFKSSNKINLADI